MLDWEKPFDPKKDEIETKSDGSDCHAIGKLSISSTADSGHCSTFDGSTEDSNINLMDNSIRRQETNAQKTDPFSVNDTFDNDNQFLTSIEKIMPTADEAGNGNEFGIEETSYQEMLQSNVRRMSSALAELHLYLIPLGEWETHRGLADKTVIENCISIGFIRVLPELMLSQIRSEISTQLETEKLPSCYVFVRGVGRHFTEIRAKQEQLLKVRNFLPPQAQEPELFLLEKLIEKQIESKVANGDLVGNKNGSSLLTLEGPMPFDSEISEKDHLQEELNRLRASRSEYEARRELLLSKAKILNARAAKFKDKLADVWEQKLQEELEKTSPLEQECASLREELDAQHKKRMEALEIKMKPIIITDGPSKKANFKIMAARLHYEIYALTQRLRLTSIRAEHEHARRERREKEVRRLRQLISEKKTTIATVTKGIPFSKLEVRPTEQLPNYSGPIDTGNPLLAGMPNAALMATGRLNNISPTMGNNVVNLPNLPGFSPPAQTSNSLYSNTVLPKIGSVAQSSSILSDQTTANPSGLSSKTECLSNVRPLQAIQTM